MKKFSTALIALALGLTAIPAHADSDSQCTTVKMADPGWRRHRLHQCRGPLLWRASATVKIDNLAVPIIFGGLKDGQVDAFLGNWMPAQRAFTTSSSPTATCSVWRATLKVRNSPSRCRITSGRPA